MSKQTPADIAARMAAKLDTDGHLYHEDAVDLIEREFGTEFIYDNERGNSAINKKVLAEFRTLTEGTTVWEEGDRSWRKRQEGDEPGRQQ